MWETTVGGRRLNFHLAGINNQNFIMRDDETGTWWQQVTGRAIFGPAKGERLKYVSHDELSFARWKAEKPHGRVLRPDDSAPWQRFSEDWEAKTAKMPVVTRADPADALEPRALVVGVSVNGAAKAYPFAAIEQQSPVLDTLGGTPLMLVLDDDRKSVRAYERVIDGRPLEFFAQPESSPLRLVDAETGSEWDFSGKAVTGPRQGAQLRKLDILKDYWFDWKLYHPETAVYQPGARR